MRGHALRYSLLDGADGGKSVLWASLDQRQQKPNVHRLSITHNFRADNGPQRDVGQAR